MFKFAGNSDFKQRGAADFPPPGDSSLVLPVNGAAVSRAARFSLRNHFTQFYLRVFRQRTYVKIITNHYPQCHFGNFKLSFILGMEESGEQFNVVFA
jgi:hypothetical protein